MTSEEVTLEAPSGNVYTVLLSYSGEGQIWLAEIPVLKIVTEGRGRNGARAAAVEAIEGYREVAIRLGRAMPDGNHHVASV